jgi:serine/threonine-protein kinase
VRSFAGRYELDERLGTTVVGDTYRASHTEQQQRVVVIKVFHDDVGADPLRQGRFEWEMATLAGLAHPNTPAVLEFGVHEGRRYLVREWLEGETLAQRSAQGPLALEAIMTIARQLLAAMAAVHAAKLLHRNLRPSNVFLERRKQGRERIKLLDFVPAQRAALEPVDAPKSFTPPEQRAGELWDARSDVFAIGAMLASMLEQAGVWTAEPTEPSALQRWVTRATSERREDRFADAAEMLRELIDRLPQNLRVAAEQPAAPKRVPLPLPSPDANPPARPRFHAQPIAAPVSAVVQMTPPSPTPTRRVSTSLPEASPIALQGSGEPGETHLTAATAVGAFVVAAIVIFSMPGASERASRVPEQASVRTAAPAAPRAPTETKHEAATASPPAPIPISVTQVAVAQPSAAPELAAPNVTAAAGTQPPAASTRVSRDPWSDGVPKELEPSRALAANGDRGNERTMNLLHAYNVAHPNDVRGVLLLGRFYFNRFWRSDGIGQYASALQRDPTARGAPEILPALLEVVAGGKGAEAAAALIEKVYGPAAVPAIDQALERVKKPSEVQRLSELSARLATRP